MNLLILSHKPPYPIIDGGCHAMDRFLRDLIKTFPSSKIKYLCIATQKHPFKTNEIPKDLGANISFSPVEISTRINPWAAFIQLLKNESYHVSRFKQNVILKKIQVNEIERSYLLIEQRWVRLIKIYSVFPSFCNNIEPIPSAFDKPNIIVSAALF